MKTRAFIGAAVLVAISGVASGQVIDPAFAGSYSYLDLGSASGVPSNYGGLTMFAGTTDTLLIGGAANGAGGTLWKVKVTRDGLGHINGYDGPAVQYGTAPYNDGGLAYGPGGVLFASQWPQNKLSQYKPGSTDPDKVIDLALLGSAGSHSAINFVPTGFAGAGKMKLSSYSGGQFYDATFAADGTGTYDISALAQTAVLGGAPEGFAYTKDSPLMSSETMVVSEYGIGQIAVYDVDANGDPVAATRKTFMTGLGGAEGAFIDPVTGDFLFSTFGGGSRIIAVRGFAVPTPSAAGLLGLAGLVGSRRRR